MPIDPADVEQVRAALSELLVGRLGTEVRFAEAPEQLGRGFDTHIYAFRLEGDGVEPAWAAPLVLRLYTTPGQCEKAQREAAVQRFAAQQGYPALDPLVIDGCAASFGLPVMVMERAPGVPMLERLGLSPAAVRRQFAAMAEAHVALHQLSIHGCPLPSSPPLIERLLGELRERVARLLSHDLSEPLAWLEAHKGIVTTETVVLCHNDFHPLNIMVGVDGRLAVLDWSNAALGDRHCDVARTLALLEFGWIAAGNAMERLVLRVSRAFLARCYVGPYGRQLAVDAERLRYWQAYHAVQAWAQLLELGDPGNRSMAGARPEALARVPPGLLPHLRRYFWKRARP